MSDDSMSFFDGLAAEAWVQAQSAEDTAAEAGYLASRFALSRPGRLLDVPCGDGRLARALAGDGHRVTGIDAAAPMLARAAAVPGIRCDWRLGSMTALDEALGDAAPFDGAYCFGNSVGYLDAAGTTAFFEAVGRRLKRGRYFVIDSEMTAESVLPNFADRLWQQVGDILMAVEHRYDAAAARLETDYLFVRDGESDRRRLDHHVFTCGAITDMLAAAGFDVVALESDLDGSPFGLGDPRLLLTAVRL